MGGIGIALAIGGSIAPDIPNAPMYLKLRRQYGRWPTEREDWSGYQTKMPVGYRSYIISHSFLAVGVSLALELALINLTHWYSVPLFSIGWLGHVLYDIPSHSGEFNIEPLWPVSKWRWGITDTWAWPLTKMAAAWAIHLVIIGALLLW